MKKNRAKKQRKKQRMKDWKKERKKERERKNERKRKKEKGKERQIKKLQLWYLGEQVDGYGFGGQKGVASKALFSGSPGQIHEVFFGQFGTA